MSSNSRGILPRELPHLVHLIALRDDFPLFGKEVSHNDED